MANIIQPKANHVDNVSRESSISSSAPDTQNALRAPFPGIVATTKQVNGSLITSARSCN